MLQKVNGMARRIRTSRTEELQHIIKIRLYARNALSRGLPTECRRTLFRLLADLDANLCREVPSSSTDSRIPLNIFKDTRNRLLDCLFVDPLTAAVYQLQISTIS